MLEASEVIPPPFTPAPSPYWKYSVGGWVSTGWCLSQVPQEAQVCFIAAGIQTATASQIMNSSQESISSHPLSGVLQLVNDLSKVNISLDKNSPMCLYAGIAQYALASKVLWPCQFTY